MAGVTRLVGPMLALGILLLAGVMPLPPYWVTLANYIGLYALVALGLVLLTGIGGLTSFGQAAFVGIGAYCTAWLSTAWGLSPWLGLVAGLLLTTASALCIGSITLRLSGHYLPLSTIAWGLSLYYLFGNLEWLGKYDGITGIKPITLLGYSLGTGQGMLLLIWTILLLALAAMRNLLDSRNGRALRALNGGAVMAEAMGVNTTFMKTRLFLLAALLACISGWLYAHLQRAVNPSPFNLNAGIEYLFMAVVGGAGYLWGAVLGAALLTLLKDQLQAWLPTLLGSSGNFEIVVFGVLMILLLQRAREGIWPHLRQWLPKPHPAPVIASATVLPGRERLQAGEPLLEVEGVRMQFGGLVAVNGVSFALRAGEIVGLIGPNGAGKSTMFNLVSGVLSPSAGQIRLRDGHGRLERIDGLSSRQIAAMGMARSFQHVLLMPDMTVLENVAIGAHLRGSRGLLANALRLDRAEEHAILAEARRQLQRVGLGELADQPAGSLALGQQRILEIARALCCDPLLLLLDEPAAGLRHLEKKALAALLAQLRSEGMSVLLVEHDMDFVMQLTDRLVVMEFGTRIAEGRPEQIRRDPAVLAAYLGGAD